MLSLTYITEAFILVREGKIDKSFELCELAISKTPTDSLTYERCAQISLEASDWQRAHSMMERAEYYTYQHLNTPNIFTAIESTDNYKKIAMQAAREGDFFTSAINFRKQQLSSTENAKKWDKISDEKRLGLFLEVANIKIGDINNLSEKLKVALHPDNQ